MNSSKFTSLLTIIFLYFISSFSFAKTLPLNLLKLPPNFMISIYAEVEDARSMSLGSNDIVYVGSRSAGNVYAIVPTETGTKVITIASNLNMPNGVAYFNGSLYVAEMDKILRFDHIEDNLTHPPKPLIISNNLPNLTHHGWRYIKFGPDKKLYVSIGAPCNICLNNDPRFATIMRLKDNKLEVFAKGIRNSVGFDWHPNDHSLWFTDNGRDNLGDNLPPDELNHAAVKNMNFGFPFCHGKNISDPLFGKLHACNDFTPPVFEFPAHVAPLGMAFYTGNLFPADYRNQIFIAEHGSWNRSSKVGYKVVAVKLKDNHLPQVVDFITGWLQGQEEWGRPVDILVMRDGSLLISDDYANVIYRVSYTQK